MKAEEKLVSFVRTTRFEQIPSIALETVKNQLLAVLGTTIAGATAEGCETAVQFYRELGGKEEATVLVHGGRIPAHDAAYVNGVMARALDFCDSMAPGPHPGSSVIPAALAATELAGGCSGRDFITALTVGTEVAARLNLSETEYDGFDPRGSVFLLVQPLLPQRSLASDRKRSGAHWPLPSIAAAGVSRAMWMARSVSGSYRAVLHRRGSSAPGSPPEVSRDPRTFWTESMVILISTAGTGLPGKEPRRI